MKISDILNENVTSVVARFYKEASADSDKFYNIEDVKYKDKNRKYYDEHFKEWFAEDIVPVFTVPINKPEKPFTVKPAPGKIQSPGYRGMNYARARAGMPYNRDVQKYQPGAPAVMSSDMNGARNSNGQ